MDGWLRWLIRFVSEGVSWSDLWELPLLGPPFSMQTMPGVNGHLMASTSTPGVGC